MKQNINILNIMLIYGSRQQLFKKYSDNLYNYNKHLIDNLNYTIYSVYTLYFQREKAIFIPYEVDIVLRSTSPCICSIGTECTKEHKGITCYDLKGKRLSNKKQKAHDRMTINEIVTHISSVCMVYIAAPGQQPVGRPLVCIFARQNKAPDGYICRSIYIVVMYSLKTLPSINILHAYISSDNIYSHSFLGRSHKFQLIYCKSENPALTLLQFNLFPCSPKNPQVCVQIEVLQFLRALQLHSAISTEAFCHAFQDPSRCTETNVCTKYSYLKYPPYGMICDPFLYYFVMICFYLLKNVSHQFMYHTLSSMILHFRIRYTS